jgi:phosphate uptake regulator
MNRKIIKQKSAFTVTLPVSWIRDHNLDAKDEISMEEEADALILRTDKKVKTEEINLHLEKGTFDYYRIMIENHYLKGYDILNLTFEDKKAIKYIREIVANLIGFEIIGEGETGCKIAITAQSSTEQFKTMLNRTFTLITHTQTIIAEDIQNNIFNSFQQIENHSKEVRRFMLFCTRTIHKSSIVERREESFLHLLLERLILIEHDNYYLYQKIMHISKHKIGHEILDFYKKSSMMFDIFKEMFFKKNLKNFAKINSMWEEIYFKEGHKLFAHSSVEESIIIYHSMHVAKLVFLISQPSIVLQKID